MKVSYPDFPEEFFPVDTPKDFPVFFSISDMVSADHYLKTLLAIKHDNLREFINLRNAGIKDTDTSSSMHYHSQVILQITLEITLKNIF